MSRPRLVAQLLTAERKLRRWVDQQQSATGLTAAGAGALFTVRRHGRAPVSAVAAELGASVSGVSGLLGRLERQGLITRVKDPDDRRSTLVELTAVGASAEADARRALAELNARITDGFSAEEIDVVGRWLAHVGELEP